MLTFLGDQVLGRGVRVYTGSVIEVFRSVGVGEQATRSTLTRMVGRGLLHRQREGRRTYVGLTARSEAILRDGERRIWGTGAVNRDWDGTWTLLGFSSPSPGSASGTTCAPSSPGPASDRCSAGCGWRRGRSTSPLSWASWASAPA